MQHFKQILKEETLSFGIPELEKVFRLQTGIVTLRSTDTALLFKVVSHAIVRNFSPGSKILFLHFVDYYKRFWTVKLDFLARKAKQSLNYYQDILDNVLFMRAFSPDQLERRENWEKISGIENVNLVIVDSLFELYPRNKPNENKVMLIGKIASFCLKNNCPAIILDSSGGKTYPFLGEMSSIVAGIEERHGWLFAGIEKHPSMKEGFLCARLPTHYFR